MATTDFDRAKRLKIYLNGLNKVEDVKNVVINKRTRSLDVFLRDLTTTIRAPSALRRLHTPTGGTVIKDLGELQHDKEYVAATRKKFKTVNYGKDHYMPPSRPSPRTHIMQKTFGDAPAPNDSKLAEVKPVVHSHAYQRIAGKHGNIPTGALRVNVYANGQELKPSHRVTIPHVKLKGMTWIKFMDNVNDIVNLNGACVAIYKMPSESPQNKHNWELVTDTEQLDDGQYYVAVGSGDTRGLNHRMKYGGQQGSFNASPKLNRRKLTYDNPAIHQKNKSKSRASDASNSTNTTTQSSATNNTAERNRGYGLSRPSPNRQERSPARGNKPPPNRRPPPQHDDPYHSKRKPVKHHRSPPETYREVDYDKDEGGVYKAKGARRETSGAQEVEENRDTQVDLPIDQVEAEEIKDEEIETERDDRKDRRRSPSPRQATPTTYRKSPAPREPTPKTRRTPTPQHRTPTPRERTPSPKHRTPTPRARSPTPVKERTPTPTKARTPTPARERTQTPKRRSPTPERKDKTPTPEPDNREQEEAERRDKAAVTIQKNYKGYNTRKFMARRKEERAQQKQRQETAAISIQSGYRGYRARKEVKHKREQQQQQQQSAKQEEESRNRLRALKTFRMFTRSKVMAIRWKVSRPATSQREASTVSRKKSSRPPTSQRESSSLSQKKSSRPPTSNSQRESSSLSKKKSSRPPTSQRESSRLARNKSIVADSPHPGSPKPDSPDPTENSDSAKPESPKEKDQHNKEDEQKKQNDAATNIQRNYRGYQGRKRVKAIRQERENKQTEEPRIPRTGTGASRTGTRAGSRERTGELRTRSRAGSRLNSRAGSRTDSRAADQSEKPEENDQSERPDVNDQSERPEENNQSEDNEPPVPATADNPEE